ncbi:MAG: hydroxylamine oxidation protein HaoB [candidate division NC10 bacterium]|nr:hydroxylamine oxidation protein HaoB [candidate division NC10 bacterium]
MGRRFGKALPVSAGILSILGGLFLLLYSYFGDRGFPYTYVLVKTDLWKNFPELGSSSIRGKEGLQVKQYALRSAADQSLLSTLYVTRKEGGPPVIIEDQTQLHTPLLRLPIKNERHQELYREVLKNTKEGSLIVAWWDHSLRISLFTGRDVLFREFLGEPLFVPESWSRHRGAISKFERQFWGIRASRSEERQFKEFLEIMLSPEEEAASALRKMAGDRPTYVVVDQADILKLSESAGRRFGIEIEDFVFTGDIHGVIGRVRIRLKEKGLKDYMVQQLDDRTVRVYYLLRPEDKERLLVRLLPFTSSHPFRLEHFRLRYQKSSLWVYELMS